MSVRGPKKKKISSDRAEGSETVSATTSSTSSPVVEANSSKKAKSRKQKHKEATEEQDVAPVSLNMFYQNEPFPQPAPPHLAKYRLTVLLTIVVLSFFTRYYLIQHPAQVSFDEVHFGHFANNYIDGKYFFDIHPPLGKYFLATTGYLVGFNTSFSWANIGMDFEDHKYIYMRGTHAFFGSCLAPIIFLSAEQMGLSLPASAIAGALVVFDNGLACISRFVFTDAFLFFFLCMSVYTSLKVCNTEPSYNISLANAPSMLFPREWWFWAVACGLSMGGLCSVKWTGVGTVGIIGLRFIMLLFLHVFRKYDEKKLDDWKNKMVRAWNWLAGGIMMVVLLLVVYTICWILHFVILCNSGPGNDWMSREFLSTLHGTNITLEPHERAPTMLENILLIHKTMYDANSGLTATHTWGSVWYTWPLNIRGVLYWTKYMDHSREIVYLFGNPFVWWGTTVVLILFLAYIFYFLFVANQTALPRGQTHFLGFGAFLLLGYVVNWIPYIGISRVCFIYHYMPSLFFAILLAALFFDYFVKSWKAKQIGAGIVIAAAAWHFWYFAPFTYGTEITTEQANRMEWLHAWGA